MTEEELQKGIKEVAERINQDYAGREVRLISILKGGVYFLTELSKSITLDVTIDFMSVSSYGSSTESSGVVKIIKDLDDAIEGLDVIIVEDIIDSGNTLSYLKTLLADRGAASIRIATMLDKPSRRVKPLNTDYSAFVIEDKFVVGYGLDYAQKYRNLPYIGEVVFDK
ncbi:MAG: hypoxanthine phosphoribosyltransferase [Eubacteriales bacterium]|nr:hypoxanthine phosphoribosyltransferase [Eubacteriales bacterium]